MGAATSSIRSPPTGSQKPCLTHCDNCLGDGYKLNSAPPPGSQRTPQTQHITAVKAKIQEQGVCGTSTRGCYSLRRHQNSAYVGGGENDFEVDPAILPDDSETSEWGGAIQVAPYESFEVSFPNLERQHLPLPLREPIDVSFHEDSSKAFWYLSDDRMVKGSTTSSVPRAQIQGADGLLSPPPSQLGNWSFQYSDSTTFHQDHLSAGQDRSPQVPRLDNTPVRSQQPPPYIFASNRTASILDCSAQDSAAASSAPERSDAPFRTGSGIRVDSAQDIEQPLPLSPGTCSSCDEESSLGDPSWTVSEFDTIPFSDTSPSPSDILEKFAVQAVIDAYFRSHQNNSKGEGNANNSPPSSSGQRNDQQRNGKKRASEDSQTAEEATRGGPVTKKRRTAASQRQGQPRLACPFQKKDPERYPECGIGKGGFGTIGHMKQHLKRRHQRNPNYCPRCKRIFSSEHVKNDHIIEAFDRPCDESLLPLPEGLSPEMNNELSKRVEKGIEVDEQWYSVWDTIFPGLPRPATCTFDLIGDIAVQTLGLSTFLERDGPLIVASVLAENNIAMVPGPGVLGSDEARRQRILSEAFRQVVAAWRHRRPGRGEQQQVPTLVPTAAAIPTPTSILEDQYQEDDDTVAIWPQDNWDLTINNLTFYPQDLDGTIY